MAERWGPAMQKKEEDITGGGREGETGEEGGREGRGVAVQAARH